MTLGFDGNPQWRDMSDYLVHFVGKEGTGHDQRERLVAIVTAGDLLPGEHGVGLGKGLDAPVDPQVAVSLSEIPLDLLDRLVQRHGPFGIAFGRDWVRSVGGNRVWYVDAGSEAHAVMVELKQRLMAHGMWADPIWKIMRYVDDVTRSDTLTHYWDWEREWRVPDRLRFDITRVMFLFAPETHHAALRGSLPTTAVLDPSWGWARLDDALDALAR